MKLLREAYLKNPCAESSLPYWKMVNMTVPENMLIRHYRDFGVDYLEDYIDEPYFRLYHELQEMPAAVLPDGFQLCDATPTEYAEHINQCYADMSMTTDGIESYFQHKVYAPELWIAVEDCKSRKIAATGIAEFDAEMGEGILEWIQVSPAHRGFGLGTYVVTELLHRLAEKARFVTVSGQVNNPSKPEKIYRKCGFKGNDVWHILRRKPGM